MVRRANSGRAALDRGREVLRRGGGKVEAAYESFDGTSARRTTPADASVVGPLIQAVAGAPLFR
jgi:hypothetical protein